MTRVPVSQPKYVPVAETAISGLKGRNSIIEFTVPAHTPVDRIVFVPGQKPANFSRDVEIGVCSASPDWWRTNPVGHFFNSLHLWSVELFMALLVIHLWGKFWMAAWRGRRAMTWITGVVAFLASIVTCFTGYLSQQNLDSQWIATNRQGRVQRRRNRGVLQPDELRPDADVAHRAPPILPVALIGADAPACWSASAASATRCPRPAGRPGGSGEPTVPPTGRRGVARPSGTTS